MTEKMIKPDFGSIANLKVTPDKYYSIIQSLNELIHADLTKRLSVLEKDYSTFLIVLPGRDGRKENANSKFEVIVIATKEIPMSLQDEIKSDLISKLSDVGILDAEIRFSGYKKTLFNNDPKNLQVARLADASLIFGDPEVLRDEKLKLGEEIIGLTASEMDRMNTHVRNASKTIREGGKNTIQGIPRVHYNLDENIIYYNPDNFQQSFKIGPLRLVQGALILEEVKHIRQTGHTNLISNLSTGIVPRLGELKDEKVIKISNETISELSEIYSFFLQLYHQSEVNFKETGKVTYTISDQVKDEISKKLLDLQIIINNIRGIKK